MDAKSVKDDGALSIMLERIGKKLLELRVKKGYSSHADFAREFGLPRIQYWRMEKGRANITLKSLDKVLAIHGMTVQQLFSELFKDAQVRKKTS